MSDLLILVSGMRRKRKGWVAICAELEKQGIKKDPGNLCRWWKRQVAAGRKLKSELEAVEVLLQVERSRTLPLKPKPKPAEAKKPKFEFNPDMSDIVV